jgi:hypothetical protein
MEKTEKGLATMPYRINFFPSVRNWRRRRQSHAVRVGTACPSPRPPGTYPNRRRPRRRITPRRRRSWTKARAAASARMPVPGEVLSLRAARRRTTRRRGPWIKSSRARGFARDRDLPALLSMPLRGSADDLWSEELRASSRWCCPSTGLEQISRFVRRDGNRLL